MRKAILTNLKLAAQLLEDSAFTVAEPEQVRDAFRELGDLTQDEFKDVIRGEVRKVAAKKEVERVNSPNPRAQRAQNARSIKKETFSRKIKTLPLEEGLSIEAHLIEYEEIYDVYNWMIFLVQDELVIFLHNLNTKYDGLTVKDRAEICDKVEEMMPNIEEKLRGFLRTLNKSDEVGIEL